MDLSYGPENFFPAALTQRKRQGYLVRPDAERAI